MTQVRQGPVSMHNQRILHCLRAPVGGLFRHVADLATAQADEGHDVGVVCAASGDALTDARLLTLSQHLTLGLHRLPMTRDAGLGDIQAWRRIVSLVRDLGVGVVHGHGAKGGAYARLAARAIIKSQASAGAYYTPHGGSLHYAPTTLAGQFYGRLERQLESWTSGILFESQFAADRYAAQIGTPRCATRVVMNGLQPSEFEPAVPTLDAADFLFVGELRMIKGVDVALEALAHMNNTRRTTAVIVGAGPDAERFKAQAAALGLQDRVTFPGALRARDAFTLGRVLLLPSRAESLPYIVLEAIAAGLPVLASNVGGIPEIIPPQHGQLLPAGNVAALSAAMTAAMDQPDAAKQNANALQGVIKQKFTVAAMAAAVTDFYGKQGLAQKAA